MKIKIRESINGATRSSSPVKEYEFVKSYPHFDLYKNTKAGYYTCFDKKVRNK